MQANLKPLVMPYFIIGSSITRAPLAGVAVLCALLTSIQTSNLKQVYCYIGKSSQQKKKMVKWNYYLRNKIIPIILLWKQMSNPSPTLPFQHPLLHLTCDC